MWERVPEPSSSGLSQPGELVPISPKPLHISGTQVCLLGKISSPAEGCPASLQGQCWGCSTASSPRCPPQAVFAHIPSHRHLQHRWYEAYLLPKGLLVPDLQVRSPSPLSSRSLLAPPFHGPCPLLSLLALAAEGPPPLLFPALLQHHPAHALYFSLVFVFLIVGSVSLPIKVLEVELPAHLLTVLPALLASLQLFSKRAPPPSLVSRSTWAAPAQPRVAPC